PVEDDNVNYWKIAFMGAHYLLLINLFNYQTINLFYIFF
ncbi:MAG: hypothetical protein US67_C0034G0001, partial [Candidatus Woesebacteria bacterium GW2011_GWD1_38_10]